MYLQAVDDRIGKHGGDDGRGRPRERAVGGDEDRRSTKDDECDDDGDAGCGERRTTRRGTVRCSGHPAYRNHRGRTAGEGGAAAADGSGAAVDLDLRVASSRAAAPAAVIWAVVTSRR